MSRLDETIADVGYILDVLTTFRRIVQSGCCNNCNKRRTCGYDPGIGQLVRYNCPFYVRRDEEGKK